MNATGDDPRLPAVSAPAARLEAALREQHAQNAAARGPGVAQALARLRAWQSARLTATYADIAEDPRHAAAIAFFRSELYGAGDYSRRDEDLERIVPVMKRMLPSALLDVVAEAVELNALSMRLDLAMAAALPSRAFTVAEYTAAFRAVGDRRLRERQVASIGTLGRAIDHYGHKRSIRHALALMRAPARAAGFGALQAFLERGLASFREMKGAQAFLATVDARERGILDAIYAGSDAPFPEPLP